MRNFLTNRVTSVLVSVIVFTTSLTVHAEYIDRVLVIVNEDVITQSQFDYRLEGIQDEIKASGTASPPTEELNKQLLDTMVSELLQLQEVDRRSLSVDDAEVASAIQRFALQQDMNVEQLNQSILARGDSVSRFTQTVRDSLNISRLTEYYTRARVVVPDYEIEGFIAQNDMDADIEYEIAHILIKDPDDQENLNLAELALSQINSGLSFTEAANVYSDAADAAEGGLLGWRTASQLPEIFATAIKSVNVGDVTEILQSDNGLHILKLVDIKGNREEVTQHMVRHILISADTDVARSYASKKLNDIKRRIAAGEDFETLARIFSDDSVSAANGGGLGWVSPGQMVPQFEATFNEMSLNEISEPFATNFGVHILQVLDRRSQNITDQLIRVQADNVLRRRRAEREFQQWVRELKEESYVAYIAEPV